MTGTTEAATTEAHQVASGAAERGKQVATTAGDQARQVAGTARDQAAQVTAEAHTQATRVFDDAKGHLHGQARAQTEQVGEALGRLAGQLRALSDGRPEEGGPAADLVRHAAQQVEQATERVRQGGFDGVVADLQRFARRRPGVFLAGALTAGFAVGRMVRAGREGAPTEARPTRPAAPPRPEPSVGGSTTVMGGTPAGADVPGADVPGADVPGADVPGADVPGADVPGADVYAAGTSEGVAR